MEINAKGECPLQCPNCDLFWHASCAGITESKLYNLLVNNKNVTWTCNDCCSSIDQTSATIKQMQASIDKLVIKITEMDLVIKKFTDKQMSTPKPVFSTPTKTFASIVANAGSAKRKNKRLREESLPNDGPKFDKPPVLVISNKDDAMQDNSEIIEKVRAELDPIIDPVNSIRSTGRGKTVVVCKDTKSAELMKNKLQTALGKSVAVDEPKTYDRLLKIVGNIPNKMSSEEIVERIIKQNDCVKDTAVITVKETKKRSKYTCIIVETDTVTFKDLVASGKVKIMWSVCSVYQHVKVITCYKCSRIGHVANDCEAPNATCPTCMGDHELKCCVAKPTGYKCVSCYDNNMRFNTSEAINHASWDFKCPVLARRWFTKKDRTVYNK